MKLGKAFFFSFFFFFSTQAYSVTQTINFSGTSFNPSTLNVSVGDVINFVGSFAAHIIQSTSVPAGAAAFGPTNAGTVTFSYTVTVAGTYNYQCNIHAAMGMTGSFTATGAPSTKGITLSANALDFGKLRVTGSLAKTVTVNSVGPDAPLTISSSPLTNGVMYTTSPTTTNRVINVGSSETETITFKPTARGIFTDVLTINSDATAVGDQAKTVSITGKGINGEFSGPNIIDFGELKVDSSTQVTYTFTNSGDDDLFITSASATGTGFTVIKQPPADIPAGTQASLTVKFLPTVKRTYSESLTMTALNTVEIPSILLTGTTPGPKLTTNGTVPIGIVAVGKTLPGTIILSNTGDDTLHVLSLSLTQSDTKFILLGGSKFNVLAGANDTVHVNYTSAVESADTAVLTINSDDLGSPQRKVKLIARSGLPKMSLDTKDTINFGNVNIGSLGLAPLVISDTGFIDLQVQIGNFSPSEFALENLTANIPAKGNAVSTLAFTPSSEGLVTGMAIVTGNDMTNTNDTIFMQGSGVHSLLTIPDSVNFHTLNITAKKDSVLTFKNLSAASEKIFSYKLSGAGFSFLDTSAHALIANGNTLIKIRFAPTSPIPYSALLSISTNDVAPVRNIIFFGFGDTTKAGSPKLSTDITSLDFGTLDSGAALTKMFTLSNKGTALATITGVTLSGSSAFSKGALTIPFSLLSGASKDIMITFAPLSAGNFNGSVAINSAESPLAVSLQGIGKITVVNNSVKDIAKEYGFEISLSPNPARGIVTIKVDLAKSSDIEMDLFDARGRLIHSLTHAYYNQGEFSLPESVQSLPSGEYYIRTLINGMSAAEAKIVVVH